MNLVRFSLGHVLHAITGSYEGTNCQPEAISRVDNLQVWPGYVELQPPDHRVMAAPEDRLYGIIS